MVISINHSFIFAELTVLPTQLKKKGCSPLYLLQTEDQTLDRNLVFVHWILVLVLFNMIFHELHLLSV